MGFSKQEYWSGLSFSPQGNSYKHSNKSLKYIKQKLTELLAQIEKPLSW